MEGVEKPSADSRRPNAELGLFLKKHRECIAPSAVGLPAGNRRRAKGLRREEVAFLAGISPSWYTRLEQGKDINVSSDVLESLVRALSLTDEERNHVYNLARKELPLACAKPKPAFNPNLGSLVNSLSIPAHISDSSWNILAWNEAEAAVFGDLAQKAPNERNFIWMHFCDERYRNMVVNDEDCGKEFVGRLRAAYGRYGRGNGALNELIGRLSQESPEFRRLWSEYDVRDLRELEKRFMHPVAGEMVFECICCMVQDGSDLTLVVHVPKPGTDEKLEDLLSSLQERSGLWR